MRKLTRDKRAMIVRCLIDGSGIRATARVCGVSKLTVTRLLNDVGSLCRDLHDLYVRKLRSERVQADEVWSFSGCKEKSRLAGKMGDGDVWVWVGQCADSKLVISYLVGDRSAGCAYEFIGDLAERVVNRIQLTSDGYHVYLDAVLNAFGHDVDYSMLIKIFGPDVTGNAQERRYSPGKCNGARKIKQLGMPDRRHVSTSYVERQNASLRLFNKRFGRLTLAFSKKLINHEHAIALHYFAHNFMRKCRTIGTSPAVAAGIADKVWTATDLVAVLEDEERKLANGGRINREDRS